MIRLTVSYNLPSGSDEEEFIAWRLTEHQRNNEAMPGVVRTDFARIIETWSNEEPPEYSFQTTVDWPDLESFERGFYDAAVQEKLQENLKRLASYTFTVSEVY